MEPPSIAIVHNMLSHADLPMDIIALAVCILDALSIRKFRNSFRSLYPRSRPTSSASDKDGLTWAEPSPQPCETILCEVAILAAMMIAYKFVVDDQQSTAFFSIAWGQNLWSCEQLNATERCIMECLDYRILPIWHGPCIKEARHDIEYARRQLLDETSELAQEAKEYDLSYDKPMSSGQAMMGLGFQMTPADTPTDEHRTQTEGFPLTC
jgi:hypothetical protein